MAMDISPLLTLAIEAADKASAAILDVYDSGEFHAETKPDQSPLTRADKRAHDAIVTVLQASGIPVLSEEGSAIAFSARKKFERLWIVDPLDGTKEFLKRNGEFTVNIALVHGTQPVAGVVAVPVSGDLFYASKGDGVFLRRNGATSRLPVAASVDIKQPGLRMVVSRSHMTADTEKFLSTFSHPEMVSKGSSLKFMLLAEGKAEIYPRFGPTMEWDTAAAHAIVAEAGFRVVQAGTNAELTYNKEQLVNPDFVVWPPVV